MIEYYYEICFGLSMLFTIIYVFLWQKHFDVNITIIFLLIPITNLGFLIQQNARDVSAAIIGIKILYLGGTFLVFFITMCVLSICEIRVNRWVRGFAFLINMGLYSSVLLIGRSTLFYKAYDVIPKGDRVMLVKVYGPMHSIFAFVILAYLLIGIAAIVYCYIKKNQISNRILRLLFIPELISAAAFFLNKLVEGHVNLQPVSYVLAQIVYLFIIRRMMLYNVIDMVIESMAQTGKVGFISVDSKYGYLGSNKTARKILPELKELSLDQNIKHVESLRKTVRHWIDHFEESKKNDKNLFRVNTDDGDEKIYSVNISYLYDGVRECGYQILIEDDTQNQKYIALLDKYNSELEEEVEEKTQHIVEMHNNLVLSMATMVESRDDSTGGHIRRTSAGVRMLIDEMKSDPQFGMSEQFCKNVAKAAPMHDLGKIAVDDAILRKTGKLTKEEYDKMKEHAAEGARIVRGILKDTDDDEFKVIAENVAHYHHEKMDGTGYPDGLKGDEIPLEARIMAIIDVYDALACKRAYKEEMPLDKVDEIVMSGFGPQFDKKLEPYYVKVRPRLEDYYNSLDERG